jgi:ankyrin repeat protein
MRVEALVAADEDVNERRGNEQTPLFWAMTAPVARALIKAGARVNVGPRDGATPLHYAAGEGNAEVVKALIEAGADVTASSAVLGGATPIQSACDLECVRLLLAAGADINAHANEPSVLFLAACCGDLALVEALLELGAPRAGR